MSDAAALPLSVYVHLPWCVRKCPYCDFNSHTVGPDSQRDDYLLALERDLEADARTVGDREVDTIFIGGGTPSLFSAAEIGRILTAVRTCLSVRPDAEVTMEANPGTVERGSMRGYREAGINRLSLGAQSFDDDALRRLGRIHGRDEIYQAFAEARAAGLASINVDLMFGLPDQDLPAALGDLRAALDLAPEHISYYQLTLEPNTVFHTRPPPGLPDDDLSADIHEAAVDMLKNAGFERYEVSAFAKPGFECRHNVAYWRFGDYLGIGAGAHGKLTDSTGSVWRSEKTAHPRQFSNEALSGEPGRRRRLDARDTVFEFMLNGLRLTRGFSAGEFERHTGQPFARVRQRLEIAAEQGLIDVDEAGLWRPTAFGQRFLNDLQSRFLPPENR